MSVPANADRASSQSAGIVSAVVCSILASGTTTAAGRADGEVGQGSGESGLPVPYFIDPSVVNCQEIGTLNESSENEPGIAGLGGAYRQGSDGDGAISKGR